MEKKSWVPTFFFFLGVVSLAALVAGVFPYWHYYLLPSHQRPLSPDHSILRPSGFAGLSMGVVGTLLIFLNLSYLIRKSLIQFKWLGELRSWMSFHVFTGILGCTLIVLHSAFSPRSALATTAIWGLIIVVVTGLVGRYIYAHTPRSLEGKELELEEIHQRLESYRVALNKLGLPMDFFQKNLTKPFVRGSDSHFLHSFWGLLVGDREVRRSYRELKHAVNKSVKLKPLAQDILPLGLRYERERQWLARYHELRAMMGGWRFLHRWFAIILLAMALFHILIAARMGNLWLFNWR
jgi:hypothetical protein